MNFLARTEIWANFSARSEPVEATLRNFAKPSRSPLTPQVDRDEGDNAAHAGKRWHLTNELNVLALIKGTEHYVFVYDDDSRAQLIDTLRDQAADPSLSLSWFDAMVLTTKAREQEQMEATPLELQECPRGGFPWPRRGAPPRSRGCEAPSGPVRIPVRRTVGA